jgi:hypothetical protein
MWEPFEISPKLARVDPYRLQKEESFEETINHVVGIGGALLAMIQRPLDFETAQQSLLQLLQVKSLIKW